MSRSRTARRGERGHAAVTVSLGAVGLLAAVGLAIDGGMAAGAYRHAQNAADAGALAAARTMFLNATSTPQKATDSATLTPVAQTEVSHNHATQLGTLTATGATTYVPNAGSGLQGVAALADVSATAGAPLAQVDAHLELVGVHSSAVTRTPATGSVASSWVQAGEGDVPAAGQSGTVTCWQATAHYTQGTDVTGTATPCAAGTMPTGVSAAGGLVVAPGPDAHVYADNHPAAAPTIQVSSPLGQIGVVGVTAGTAATHNVLGWNAVTGLTSYSSTYASNVQASLTGLTISIDAIDMRAAVSVDSHGTTSATMQCTPATVTVTDTVSHVTVVGHVDATCSAPGLQVAGISQPYTQPSSNVCSTDHSGVVSCSYQTCFLRASVATTPYPTALCLGENNVVLAASPSTAITGTVSVSAQVDQPTYFLGVLGWTHTTPSASAGADLEAVVDESQAAFTLSPFAMPDTATNMSAPFAYEHLRAGQTYYLYGLSMQTDNPSPMMPATWQGQLSAASPHRVGTTLVGSTAAGSPQPYLTHGPYYLVPIFDPITNLVESYGVFIPVTGHPNWGTLVNSLSAFSGQPSLHGYIVQSTSLPGWITYEEGAVAVKLTQ